MYLLKNQISGTKPFIYCLCLGFMLTYGALPVLAQTVNVTFRVDMTGVDISQGVYLNGDVTGWTRTSMTLESGNIYKYTTTLTPNSNGGFYFLNADDFDNSDGFGREPNNGALDGCDTWDESSDIREYLVPSNDVLFSYKWGSCSFIEEKATVPAVFTVDMTGVDVSQGVYINGGITGWIRTQMTAVGNNIYSYQTDIAPNSNGGFYFLNANDFDNSDGFGREPNNGALDGCDTWDGNNDIREYLVMSDQAVYAFDWGSCTALPQYDLSISTPANATISINGENVLSNLYSENTIVSIMAIPNAGYRFDGWSGDAPGTDNPLSVTMDADKNISASFSEIPASQFGLTVNAGLGGSVDPPGGVYDEGQVVDVTAIPDAGYQFDGWSGDATGTDNPLSVTMDANKNIGANFSVVPRGEAFYLGVDMSYANELEDCGTSYFDRNNEESDVYKIMSTEGANMVRLRLWHNPGWTNYSNLADVEKSIQRAKAEGMAVLLDFHYSDFWADPGRQWRPAAWEDITDDQILGDSLYLYTYNTLLSLKTKGLSPDVVQIGNEINGNILLKRGVTNLESKSPGLFPLDWSRQVALLDRGIEAVTKINEEEGTTTKTLIHVAQPENALWWFEEAKANGLEEFDIIGISYYPQFSELNVRQVGEHVAALKETHQKDVMIVETGYPWTIDSSSDEAGNILGLENRLFEYGSTFSVDLQRDYLIELSYLIKENGGLGLVYWEPAWVSSSCKTFWATGSHWENVALFDFDNKLHAGADFLSYDYSVTPEPLMDKEVVFRVDMSGVDTKDGVFVTGDFSGTTWGFQEMSLSTDNLFEFNTYIPGRSSGAYAYYNDDIQDHNHREAVPSACAKIDGIYREYVVRDEKAVFYFAWSSCDQNVLITELKSEIAIDGLTIYPNPLVTDLVIESPIAVSALAITDQSGKSVLHRLVQNLERLSLDLSHLPNGVYVLSLTTINNQTKRMKLLKH